MKELIKAKEIIKSEDSHLGIYLFEEIKDEKRKTQFRVYKMLFGKKVKSKIIDNLKNVIQGFIKLAEDSEGKTIQKYNPDEEQGIFKVAKSEVDAVDKLLPFLTEEIEPYSLSPTSVNKESKIKAWVVKLDYEDRDSSKQVYFFQKFLKSQFMIGKRNILIWKNEKYELINKINIVGIGDTFDVILLGDVLISKNVRNFEYIFNFVEHYKSESISFIEKLNQEYIIGNKFTLDIEENLKKKIKKKIERSKRLSHKIFSIKRNEYFKHIRSEKLYKFKQLDSMGIRISIKDQKITIVNETGFETLIKILNDDYESSLITDNKYISQKKQKFD